MRKKTFNVICTISGAIILLAVLMFLDGSIESERYCDPLLAGNRLSEVLERAPATRESIVWSPEDVDLLFKHKEEIRDCVIKWLNERYKFSECFYFFVVEGIEGITGKRLAENRGAASFHADAIKATEILSFDDQEIRNALFQLKVHYEGSKYSIIKDIEKLLEER